MKKILLIEDRFIRQQFFINETHIDLESYSDILDNCIKNDYDELELQLSTNNFNFSEYDYIIAHKSAFSSNNTEILEKLRNYCKVHGKSLILFSGGIATNYYDTSEFELLEINSKTFYSKNLELFLEATKSNNENILMLCYGKEWKKNILSNVIEKINIFIGSNQDEDIDYAEFITAVDMEQLIKMKSSIYSLQEEDGWVFLEEIIKFRDSLYNYINEIGCQYSGIPIENTTSILVHNDNIFSLKYFKNRIKFSPSKSDIDKYISTDLLPEIKKREFDIIYIKDNLSSNYLELYGIRLAYHIRLSVELGDKRFIPIVIISDFKRDTLIRYDSMSNILLTQNIFLVQNNQTDIESIKKLDFFNLTPDDYHNNFLTKVVVEQPKDYLTHHDIANEWSIHTWAEFLKIKDSQAIDKNREKISSMLYFKYLLAKYPVHDVSNISFAPKRPQSTGNILYIDDQWAEGWSEIFEKYYSKTPNISFNTFNYEYKDMNKFNFLNELTEQIKSSMPDMILLDLRLTKKDHEETDLEQLTGIKILNIIKEINKGIQVVMFTATTQSRILENLYDKGILGYIQKEHPAKTQLNMKDTFLKLKFLTDSAFEKSYLKEIWNVNKQIKAKLLKDPFSQYISDIESYKDNLAKLIKESEYIFDILNSEKENKFNYALVSLATCLDALQSIFIDEYYSNGTKEYYYLGSLITDQGINSLPKQITYIIEKSGNKIDDSELKKLNKSRNYYIHSNPAYIPVNSEDINKWFLLLNDVISKIER